jgi:hypothetical protein
MLNRTIVAAFLATSASAFGATSAAAADPRCVAPRPASEQSQPGPARPLGTVDVPAPAVDTSERPRTVRA